MDARSIPLDTLTAMNCNVIFPTHSTVHLHIRSFHILISELLGSIGDNELCPEILAHGLRLLRADGISIPQSSTNYFQPIFSSLLWSSVLAQQNSAQPLHLPYLVRVSSCLPLDQTQRGFSFHYSVTDSANSTISSPICASTFGTGCLDVTHSVCHEAFTEHEPVLSLDSSQLGDSTARSCTLQFRCSSSFPVLLHGFLGYFESHLFGNIIISTRPETFSCQMMSWFPAYFPLENPVRLAPREPITFTLNRVTSPDSVHYEWTADTEHVASALHNADGLVYHLKMVS